MTNTAPSPSAEALLPATSEQIDRRKSLLQAAFDVIATAGFEGLRTRAVAARAGVNVATLHYYFPTKDALVHGLADFLSTVFATLHSPEQATTGHRALDYLRREFRDMRFYREQHPELMHVMGEMANRARRDPAVQSALERMLTDWRGWIGQMVRTGIAEGTFRSGLDAEQTVSVLQAILAGGPSIGVDFTESLRLGVEEWILSPEVKEQLKGMESCIQP